MKKSGVKEKFLDLEGRWHSSLTMRFNLGAFLRNVVEPILLFLFYRTYSMTHNIATYYLIEVKSNCVRIIILRVAEYE